MIGVASALDAGRPGRVVLYASVPKPRITLCADTFGRVAIFEGSLLARGMATQADYSICLESDMEVKRVTKALDAVGIEHGFGALLTK